MITKERILVTVPNSMSQSDYHRFARKMDTILANKDNDKIELCYPDTWKTKQFVERYCRERKINGNEWEANWDLYKGLGTKNPAGYKRNTRLAKCAGYMIAFWDGNDRVVQDIISKFKKDKHRHHGMLGKTFYRVIKA